MIGRSGGWKFDGIHLDEHFVGGPRRLHSHGDDASSVSATRNWESATPGDPEAAQATARGLHSRIRDVQEGNEASLKLLEKNGLSDWEAVSVCGSAIVKVID